MIPEPTMFEPPRRKDAKAFEIVRQPARSDGDPSDISRLLERTKESKKNVGGLKPPTQ
jgi:hypothetical protein